MATLKQFEANRRNAQKSTGPKTPEGKAAVSMNALRHGLRARTVVLPGENREEFNHLCDDLEVEWHPQSRTEQFYLEQMAVSQWKLTRMEVGEAAIFEDVAISTTKSPAAVGQALSPVRPVSLTSDAAVPPSEVRNLKSELQPYFESDLGCDRIGSSAVIPVLLDLDFLPRRDDFLVGQAVRLSPATLHCGAGLHPAAGL
jgi:hypothetical protein